MNTGKNQLVAVCDSGCTTPGNPSYLSFSSQLVRCTESSHDLLEQLLMTISGRHQAHLKTHQGQISSMPLAEKHTVPGDINSPLHIPHLLNRDTVSLRYTV